MILLDETTDTEEVLDIDPTEELVPAGEYLLKATFTPTDSTNYAAMTAYAIFVVEQAVPTVTVEDAGFEFGTLITEEDLSATVTGIVGEPVEGTIEFYVGDIALSELTQPLAVRAYPLTAKFISADPNYADAESEETAWLTVTQSDMGVVTWQPKTEITYGETIALDAVATVNGKELASGDELSYTVKYKGEVYPLEEGAILNAGEYEVRAEYVAPLGGGYADARTEWIGVTVAQAESVITWENPADITDDTALSDAQLNATANVEGTFEYDPAAGTYLEAGTYTLTTIFTPASANYKQATASVELTVELSIVLELTWETPEPIDYGTPLSEAQLNATANVEGRYFYNPTIGTVLNGGVQKLIVIFKPANKKYKTQYKDVELVVNKLEQTIEFDPIGEVREGDVFILNASTDRELPVRFESSDEEIVKIEGNVATVVGSGTVTITAIQDGNVNYEAVSAEQTLVIESEVPQISYEVDLEAGTMTLKFTGDLYESEDGKTWTLVEGAKDTYTVDIKQGKMKLYCAGK